MADTSKCSVDPIDYACFTGIDSTAAAIILAIIYIPLLALFIRKSIAQPTYVYIILAFFCGIRVAAFITRTLLAGTSLSSSLSLLIANQVIYSVGFFGLLYSAYTLVLDRELLAGKPVSGGIIAKITRNRSIFRLTLTAAVALGITGSCEAALSSKQSDITLGHNLRTASTAIFLVLTVLLTYQTILLTKAETEYSDYSRGPQSFGAKRGVYVLLFISVLLLTREAFLIGTSGDLTKQDNEHFWYPFAALTELLAVMLFLTSGLVPPKHELPK